MKPYTYLHPELRRIYEEMALNGDLPPCGGRLRCFTCGRLRATPTGGKRIMTMCPSGVDRVPCIESLMMTGKIGRYAGHVRVVAFKTRRGMWWQDMRIWSDGKMRKVEGMPTGYPRLPL